MYSEKAANRSLALKREAQIKRLKRQEKKGLFKKSKSRRLAVL